MKLLDVVQMLVRLHVDAEVPLGGGGVVADLTSEGLVPAGVGFSSAESGMRLVGDAVDAGRLSLRVLLLHVNLEGLLVLVMPVTLGALQGLA